MLFDQLTKKISLLKTKSLRRGLYFKALDQNERGIVSLTLKLVKTVRSSVLRKILTEIASKLDKAVKLGKQFIFERVGTPIAQAMVSVAKSWGYYEAENWLKDVNYARFLGLNKLSSSSSRFSVL